MKNSFNWYKFYLIFLVLFSISLLFLPCFCIIGEGKLIASAPAFQGMKFSICFIHSVQKTPVQENLCLDKSGFRLDSTEYKSFGVGLPFLESDGNFRIEGESFIMDHMNRHFEQLSLRTGVGTELRILLHGREYRLYEMFPPGTRIDIQTIPIYEVLYITINSYQFSTSWRSIGH